jgi:hypothetical protein
MCDTLMPQKLHANIGLDLLCIFCAAHAEKALIILLSFFVVIFFLDLIQVIFDDHSFKNCVSIFMLSIKGKFIT